MREYQKKMKSKEGFTLAELLIVVAIIAILAMISIPIFTSRMQTAKENTDLANERSAKAAAVAAYLSGTESDDGVIYYYDVDNGSVDTNKKNITCSGYNQVEQDGQEAKAGIISVKIGAKGANVEIEWVAK